MIWFAASMMIIVALVMILLPLWRSRTMSTLDSNTANVVVLKQQLRELELEHAAGNLSDELYAQASEDLQMAVAADLTDEDSLSQLLQPNARRWISLFVIVLLPLSSILLYQQVNTYREAPQSQEASTAQSIDEGSQQQLPSVAEMAEVLAARLRQDPENQAGWKMLGKTYALLQKIPEAEKAYERAYKLGGDEDAELLADYAEVLAFSNDNLMQGRPEELVTRALALYPGMTKALWLKGFANYQREDYAAAVQDWQRVLNDPDTVEESRAILTQYIAEARKLGGLPEAGPADNTVEVIKKTRAVVHVSLDSKVTGQVKPDDVVFVFARLAEGMPMPLAAKKMKVSELPATVILDESMAMVAGHTLAGKDKVVIGARVSKSGAPIPQPGDIQGLTGTVSLKEASEFVVTIDQIVN